MTAPSRAKNPANPSRNTRKAKPRNKPRKEDIRDQVNRLKREAILSAAAQLFQAQGFARTTLDEIAAAIGMTKPFIYQFFPSKAALLGEICSLAINNGHETLNRTLPQQATATEKLRTIIREFTLSVLNYQASAIIYSREETELADKDRARIIRLRRDFDRKLVQLLEEGSAQGEFDVDDVRLTSLNIGSMIGWAPVWFREDRRLSREQAADGIAAHALRLVRAKEA